MKTILALITSILAITSLASARPGETKEAIAKRFGVPKSAKINGPSIYEHDAFRISITWRGNLSAEEKYTLKNGAVLDDDTLTDLLTALADGKEFFERGPTANGGPQWLIAPFTARRFGFWACLSADRTTLTCSFGGEPLAGGKRPNAGGL